MGANRRSFILMALLFAAVLLISSEVLAAKDLSEKMRETVSDKNGAGNEANNVGAGFEPELGVRRGGGHGGLRGGNA
ncbi:hypothetical protein MKW94_003915 [Papaver nudicaule]|uniref:Glycine-rich protein n=1 Tax=Papaver nudicaule TaxID=74823 RepID=A0AA42B4C2_PAPNU|nr:hypothetical protein [Papaver nudicaule]